MKAVLTLGDMRAAGMELSAYCKTHPCWHRAPLDLGMMIRECGSGYACSAYALTPLLRCSRCGGKDVGIQIHAKTASHAKILGSNWNSGEAAP